MLAFLIALSVAILPAAGDFAFAATSDAAVSTVDHDCEHHHGSCDDHSKAMDDCLSVAGCAAKCFNFVGNLVSGPAFVPVGAIVLTLAASQVVASEIGIPPFRPPRV